MTRIIRRGATLGDIARALETKVNLGNPTTSRVVRSRRDYTARELREMADRARAGDAPPNSPGDVEIRRAELSGDFERANALRREVKEKAPALARLARAAERAERRASKRKGQ